MQSKKFVKMIKILTICATCFIFFMVGLVIVQSVKINKKNATLDELDTQIETLTQESKSLEEKNEKVTSEIYVEEYARRVLKMLDDGEVFFYFD